MSIAVELKDLVGAHKLSGVDFESQEVEIYSSMETVEVCRFRLDGKIYTAIQNPDDGYRSSMKELIVSDSGEMKNQFEPVPVFCIHRTVANYGNSADILDIFDAQNAKLILAVGTDNTDDYYPCFISSYTPENMSVNAVIPD